MKSIIQSSALSVFILFLFACAYGQNLDLIVTTKGDSIACRIDSVSETHIYIEMRSQGARIHTHLNKKDVSEYKREVIDRKAYLFEAGTSIIKSSKPAAASLYQVQRNSVYVGVMTLMYSRMFPVDKTGITLGAGIFNFDGWGVIGESTLLVGGLKHYFEPGIMLYHFLTPDYIYNEPGDIIGERRYSGVTLRAGYRYQGPKGLLLRGAANLIYFDGEFYLWPALSLGYSF
ncbi:MAG: hypothetical protein ABFS28_10105 [Bacteroidota bacterium]